MTLNTSLSGLSIMNALVVLCIKQHMTFEVPSFTDSKDMIAGQNLKNGSNDPDHAHHGVVCHS